MFRRKFFTSQAHPLMEPAGTHRHGVDFAGPSLAPMILRARGDVSMTDTTTLFPFDLGDKRRNQRANRIVRAMLDNAGASIPDAAGSRASTDATYRFLDNPNVTPENLDDAHRRDTLQRIHTALGPILIAQDTTSLDFTSPARMGTLGELAHAKHRGFFVHSGLAMTAKGQPLGLPHQHVWMRPPEERGKRKDRRRKETADKESQRWLDTEQACVKDLPADRLVITMSDREGDFYDHFAMSRRPGQHVLIRAKSRRRVVESKELLGLAIRGKPVAGTIQVRVPRNDGQPGREATVSVRYGTYSLKPPSTHPRRTELAPLPLQVVYVEEPNPPAGREPLRWLLLTTLPVTSLEEAVQVVQWYVFRWRIERYHYVLKSGCKLEELQLETAERLRRALALVAMVAARLLHLTYRSRQKPDVSREPAVSTEEWEVLWRHFFPGKALPTQPPTLREAVRLIGRLGGFLGRKGDGEPGVKSVVAWLAQTASDGGRLQVGELGKS